MLSSIGIGTARLDLQLSKGKFAAGETVYGQLKVEGGQVDQLVSQVYIKLLLSASYKKDDKWHQTNREFGQAMVAEGFEIKAGSKAQVMPVTYVLPENIPVSTFCTKYFLVTGLDIASAVDPTDNDIIEILPGHRQGIVMQAIEKELGFSRAQGPTMGVFKTLSTCQAGLCQASLMN